MTPWTVAHPPGPLFMGFPRQDYSWGSSRPRGHTRFLRLLHWHTESLHYATWEAPDKRIQNI